MTTTHRSQYSAQRAALDTLAAAPAETVLLVCGACAVEAHGRCIHDRTMGELRVICPCPCWQERAEAFDNLYGPLWLADRVDEGE